MPSQIDIEHLLRRTEYIARPTRVAELAALPSIEAAVDNILAVAPNPGSVTFNEDTNWEHGVELTHYWLNRMAFDSPRPIQEKMAFFWHGHLVTEFGKSGSAVLMREQIDTYRRDGLGNLRSMVKEISTQVAMLRYLDNNRNRDSSPNQNFAREILELFLLGVGNYNEADVESGTLAWTGHSDNWETDQYVWRSDWHDSSVKTFMGRTINSGADPTLHAYETIDVILGNGLVPNDAPIVANRGRNTRDVAAEFVSKKLWIEFVGTEPPPATLTAIRDVALANDFDITPWVRAILTHADFYTSQARTGLVRPPVETMVAMLAATGHRSEVATPLWLMDGMGQRPLYRPNVAGWKHNQYWINASAMAKRTDTARSVANRSLTTYWGDERKIYLAGGTISRDEIETTYRDDPTGLLDRIIELMHISLSAESYAALETFSTESVWWERSDLIALTLLAPEFHMA